MALIFVQVLIDSRSYILVDATLTAVITRFISSIQLTILI